jgi:hypothetical protein
LTDDSISKLDEKYQDLMQKAKDSTELMWAEASSAYRNYAKSDEEFSENHTLASLRTISSTATKIALRGGEEAA